jgi:protein-S-isoprenylcysteine O-methyltransferase Ste14
MSEVTKAIRPPGVIPPPPAARASAVLILGYAAAVYGLFLAALVYAVGFFAGFAVPKDIDDGLRSGWPLAVAIDVGLLLLFAAAATGYILAGIWFEERDLVRSLGPAYASYLASVPTLIPGLRRRRS